MAIRSRVDERSSRSACSARLPLHRAAALIAVFAAAGCSQVEVSDLGTLGGASTATGINDFALIVGTSRASNSDADVPVQFQSGTATRLPMLSTDRSCNNVIVNRAGSIRASCRTSDNPEVAHLVLMNTEFASDAGTLLPGWSTYAAEINDDLFTVGWATDPANPDHRLPWYALGGSGFFHLSTDLTANAEVLGVNNQELLVGSLRAPSGQDLPVIWVLKSPDSPPPQYSPQVLSMPPSCKQGRAHDVNNRSLIVGECDGRPIVWLGGKPEVLPVPALAAGDSSIAVSAIAANDENQIIGTVVHHRSAGDRVSGVGWTPERQLVDLGDVEPVAIDNAGLTVGRQGSRAVRITW
ncbi:MAG TPA: hypothetical protein VK524_24905 [Polyangiaceae bacterium]|nr:hypothetical protein [Polyangiaceae bacterium]